MERRMVALGRAKKKLRYFQTEEGSQPQLKIKDVFSVKDIDNIFDDLDSPGPGTMLLSSLPTSPEMEGQMSKLKSSLPFEVEVIELKDTDALGAEIEIQPEDLNGKVSPILELAPIQTSSPIELLTGNIERPENPPPVLFAEDVELEAGDLIKPESDQSSEPSKMILIGDFESLVTPPAQLMVTNSAKQDAVPGTSSEPPKPSETPVIESRSSAPVIESRFSAPVIESQALGPFEDSQASAAEVQEDSQKDNQPSTSQNHQTKTTRDKQPNSQVPEAAAEVEDRDLSFQKKLLKALQPRMKAVRKQRAKKQATAPPPAPEDDFMILDDDAPIRFVIPKKVEPNQKGRSLPEQSSTKPEHKEKASLVEPVSPKQTKQAPKRKGEPGAGKQKSKEKPGKALDVVAAKEAVAPAAAEESEQPLMDAREEVAVGNEPPGLSSETSQTVPAVKKSTKQPKTKQPSSKRPPASKEPVKTLEKTKVLKVKELPVPESDVSTDTFVSSKRKRKPPGEWWLSQPEPWMQEQGDEAQPSQELKPKKKTKRKMAVALTEPTEERIAEPSRESSYNPPEPSSAPKRDKKLKKAQFSPPNQKTAKTAATRKGKSGAPDHREAALHEMSRQEMGDGDAAGRLSPAAPGPPRWRSVTPGDERLFSKTYARDNACGSVQKAAPASLDKSERLPVKRQRRAPRNFWIVSEPQETITSSQAPQKSCPQRSRPQMARRSTFVARSRKTAGPGLKANKAHMVNTPKSVKKSLAAFNAILASGKPGSSASSAQRSKQKVRRNLLDSLKDQSSENIHEEQQLESRHEVCMSGVTTESFAAKKASSRFSSGSNRVSEAGLTLKSGPSSMIEPGPLEEHDDVDLPLPRAVPQTAPAPRVLSDCDLCGPPLKPIVLEAEDWDNLCTWFSHIWPTTSKNGQVISPDDFHWYCHAGRAMGHMVDLQTNSFSSGKVLLGSFMKKPLQVDLDAVTVFNVASSCVRVEIDGIQQVYNSGRTFVAPCGQPYSVHNMCREPAVLWYHRMLQNRPRK